jgi:hypothetical protein
MTIIEQKTILKLLTWVMTNMTIIDILFSF